MGNQDPTCLVVGGIDQDFIEDLEETRDEGGVSGAHLHEPASLNGNVFTHRHAI